jgi:hypothetical protein
MIFDSTRVMEIHLNETQIGLIKQRQATINACQLEMNHAQDKLNSFITGVVSSKGVVGQFNYRVTEDKLVIEFPEVKPPIEE